MNYGGKYKGLEIIKKEFNLKVPESFLVSIGQLEDIFGTKPSEEDIKKTGINKEFTSYLNNIADYKECYIIRSSSMLEGFNSEDIDLSGIYKTVIKKNKKDIFEGIKEVLLYNFSEHILFLHKKYDYKFNIYIPIIIQKLIKGDIAGVLIFEDGKIRIDYSKKYNFGITSGKGENISSVEFDTSNLDNSETYLFGDLLINTIKISNKYDKFILEFSIKDDVSTILQFNDIKSNVRGNINYLNLYENLFNLMNSLGFGINDFAILENDSFLFYNFLGIEETKVEDIEHIRILLLNNKFGKSIINVKEGRKKYIHPSSEIYQRKILNFFERIGLAILFLDNEKRILKNRLFIYKKNYLINKKKLELNFYIEEHKVFTRNNSEKRFFVNKLNKDNFKNIYESYKTKVINYSNIFKNYKLSDDINFILKTRYKELLLYIKILKSIKPKIEKSVKEEKGKEIFGKSLGKYSGIYEYECYTNIFDIKKVYTYNNIKKVFVCNDFEPSWIPYLDYIDLIVTARPYRSSHGVMICKEFGKKLIYDCKNIHLLKKGKMVTIDLKRATIYLK